MKSEGKVGREDPTWNYRGGIIESLKWNKKCVPEISLKLTFLVRGADSTPHPAHRHLLGWGEQEGASSRCLSFWGGVIGREPPLHVSPLPPPADLLLLPRLCCDLCALPPGGPFPALHCSPPTISLSWILSAATSQPGDTGITIPSPAARELPSPLPPPLALG